MSLIVVWMDREQAKLFEFSNEKMQRESFRASRRIYDVLAERLKSAVRILVIGPGLAKDHFKHYLEENATAIAKKVVGYETVDQPTDHQIAMLAMKHFRL